MRINKRTKKLITQAVEYMIAGGAWFWSGYIIIVILDDYIPLFWANFIGNAVGITINFLLNKYWVFKTKKQSDLLNTTWRYVVYTALNAFVLNYLILKGLRTIGIEPEIGQFIAAGFFTFWNFIWYNLWVFKGQDKPIKRIRHHA
ncbi:MAG: GtrA family protein [Patescibacteria group bacterium]|nr:GtrA family protein [Patescibacteria group bacterium]